MSGGINILKGVLEIGIIDVKELQKKKKSSGLVKLIMDGSAVGCALTP